MRAVLVVLAIAQVCAAGAARGEAVQVWEPNELDLVHVRLEGIREKCLVEDLPENTVVLIKHSASAWSSQTNQRVDTPFQVLVTVRDPAGYTVTRQQSKPADRLFLTAASTGMHMVCFQAMHQTYAPNAIVKLGLEIFIGDAGDPSITSPMEAQLTDIGALIHNAAEQAADLQREQTLQREREGHFRVNSRRLNGRVVRWAFVQAVLIGAAALYQVHHMRRFFRAKKLV